MSTLIKRESLVAQVVDILRHDLSRYVRFKWLPGERVLCEQFQVSRTTLRAVLAQLQRQGLIRAVPCKGYRVQSNVRPYQKQDNRIIGCLQEAGVSDAADLQSQLFIRDIEHSLNRQNYQMRKTFTRRIRGRNNNNQLLSSLVVAQAASCWVLLDTALETQRWFEGYNVPTLVLGSCHPGISLPNMDVDYAAICRHAVTLLWRQGHRRIAFLTPRDRLGGDILSENGFLEGWRQVAGSEPPCHIIRHDGSVGGICHSLNLGWAGPAAPTALLVSRSMHALTAAGYLMHCGLRLPQDLSLVCRDSGGSVDTFVPTIAQYSVNWGAFARRCARALIQLATAGSVRPRHRFMMARFLPGDSMAPVSIINGRRPIL